jgi:hypothetical protein
MLTSADLISFMGINTPVPADLQSVVDWAVAATNGLILDRCENNLNDTDPWSPSVEYAAKLQGARLVKRRASPEGVAGMGDFGPVRVSVLDPDIENMLSFDLWLTFA